MAHGARLLALCFALLVSASPAAGQGLTVEKIEPPNWWVGMRWNRVQLMLYGENLRGISARIKEEPVTVGAVHTLPNASYAFVDVEIPHDTPPGDYTLEISRGSERAEVTFSVRARTAEGHRGFGPEDVIYLITPDRFANGNPANDRAFVDEFDPTDPRRRHGGDLDGLIDRLDYLADLGVTALWLNPVLENAGRNSYHGYAATDLYRIDPRFGTNEDYRRLVEEAHRRGLKVIFDHVSNHIGIGHPWIDNLPSPSWLNGTPDEHLRGKHYTLSITDPHADPQTEEELRSFWFVDAMPDLNQRDPFLANYLIQNTLWWMEYSGLDGIREDTYPYPDQGFLSRWEAAVLEEYPEANIVGEAWVSEPATVSAFQRASPMPGAPDTNLPAVMDFPLSEALRRYVSGEGRLVEVYRVIAQDFVYADLDNLLTFVDNHDMSRAAFLAEGDDRRVRQVLALLLTTRGIPQLLYGTEISMRGGESHVELRADFPGGFPGDERSAFTKEGRTAGENAMFDFLRHLLHLRRDHTALTSGPVVHYPPTWNNDVYKYLRLDGDEMILVVLNGHDEERDVELSELEHRLSQAPRYVDLLTREEGALEGSIHVEPLGVRILRITKRM